MVNQLRSIKWHGVSYGVCMMFVVIYVDFNKDGDGKGCQREQTHH